MTVYGKAEVNNGISTVITCIKHKIPFWLNPSNPEYL